MTTILQPRAVGEPDVARPTRIGEVIELVDNAVREGRPTSVRGIGSEGREPALRLDLSALSAIAINSYIGTVRVQAGATWGEVDRATRPLGLVIPAATSPEAGVRGRTLAEDAGEPTRLHGPASDSLLEVAVVLPGAGLVVANAYGNAGLFAAIRDGRDIPGVAVSFLFQARSDDPIERQSRSYLVGAPIWEGGVGNG